MVKITSLILKGFILGISMVLPGISGGTMAFILGIYEKLIGEISKTRIKHLKSLFLCLSLKKSQIQKGMLFLLKTWDWAFLMPLIFGIVFSVVLFVALASPLIEQYHLPFYSIIFGLVLASVFKPFKEMKKTAKTLSLFFLSLVINVVIFSFGKSMFLFSEEFLPVVFLPVGFLVSSTLIIPGISGSYLLVIFGLYEKTLQALRQADLVVIIFFSIGVILGLFSVARGINHLIKRHFNETIAVIVGLILGSLYAVYPLPKNSLKEILSFDTQKQTFFLFFIVSFFAFIILSFFYEKKLSKTKV